jgi:DNA-binding NtrC family response regulator/tetratricopeptide (TPR) repeat protein
LNNDPNSYLGALVEHGESSILALSGDFHAALGSCRRAAALAAESGWAKGIVAVAGNLGYLLDKLDRPREAEEQLTFASQHVFKSPTYQLAIAETRAEIAIRAGEYDRAERILTDVSTNEGRSAVWYELVVEATRAHALLRQRRWTEALRCSEAGLARASAAGAESEVTSFLLAKAEALLELKRHGEATQLLFATEHHFSPVTLLGAYWLALANALRNGGLSVRALEYFERGTRLLERTRGKAAVDKARRLQSDSEESRSVASRAPNLDDAVALLDLVGSPHLLAGEAFAVLSKAECTNGLGLIARGGTEPRVVASQVWDSRRVLGAEHGRGEIEKLHLGEHCEETWQIVARPREELEHRCTFAAIKKLIAALTELDVHRRAQKQRAALWPVDAMDQDGDTVWASEQMSEVLRIARRIAPTPLSVLLTGETGTGKEMLAREIHRASDRADRTFLPFNCTAVPRDMLESQLFGYRKGAFTGADASFPGVIRSAAGGTLFLDEIADVPLDLQPKLLRFLETHEIHPLGEPQPITVDLRIVAATNANLEQLVAEGRFREDLFYRLNVVRLKLPPLRERREEIPALVQHYLRKSSDEQKKGQLTLADETLEYLLLYAWPGNIRQLANEVRRMAALAEPDSALTPALLSPELQASRRTIPAAAAPPPAEPEILLRLDQPLPVAVEILEQTMIRSALTRSRGRVEEAARLLGISRKGLFLKRRRWNLDQKQAS